MDETQAQVSVSPRVRALEALIAASLDELERGPAPAKSAGEALLFIGNWNDALPRLLIHDPVLEPVDKIVWAVIKTCSDPRRGTAFPNYATIARLANVSAEGTVTRALVILRVTRWLTLCGRARDGRGRFRGNVYALHDEPLSLADMLHLDPDYLELTTRATSHGHARVRLVARGVVHSLEMDTAEDRGIEATDDPVVARVEAQQLIHQRGTGPEMVRSASVMFGTPTARVRSAVFSRSFATRFELLPEPTPEPVGAQTARSHADEYHPQKLRAVTTSRDQPQKLKPQSLRHGSSCSSDKEKTTTTTPEDPARRVPRLTAEGPADDALNPQPSYRWPVWLVGNARHLAALELRRAPASLRQVVLDQLDQRRRDGEAAIAEPLHYPIQYLRSLCRLAAKGRITQPPETPSAETETSPSECEQLKQQLQVAESDRRHWLRLASLTDDPKRKGEWQDLAERAGVEADRCRTALDALRGS